MARKLLVTLPDYYRCPVKPLDFFSFCDMFDATLGPLGLWCLKVSDRLTGEVLQEIWTKNIVTDNGALAMLKNTWNSAGGAIGIFNQIALAANAGSTTLTSALAANTANVTSLSVAALPAGIPSGTVLTLGYGGSAPQNVTTSAAASAGATSISVNSFTVNSTGFAVGANVVPNPTTSDNPSSVPGAQYSGALAAGNFTFSGTGAGNRQVVITFTFNGSSFTAGNYTEAYTTNANPIASGSTATHLITTPMALNTNTNVSVTINEKI
jgi:hypothetical protein